MLQLLQLFAERFAPGKNDLVWIKFGEFETLEKAPDVGLFVAGKLFCECFCVVEKGGCWRTQLLIKSDLNLPKVKLLKLDILNLNLLLTKTLPLFPIYRNQLFEPVFNLMSE